MGLSFVVTLGPVRRLRIQFFLVPRILGQSMRDDVGEASRARPCD